MSFEPDLRKIHSVALRVHFCNLIHRYR